MSEDKKAEYSVESVETSEDIKEIPYSIAVTEEDTLEPGEETIPFAQTSEADAAVVKEGIVTIPASLTPKGYNKELAYIIFLALLSIGGALIAAFLPAYMISGIVIAVLGALADIALVRHVFESKRIAKLVACGECRTISDLMRKTGKARKAEFIRTVGGIIRDGHLTGYALIDDEIFVERRMDCEENKSV